MIITAYIFNINNMHSKCFKFHHQNVFKKLNYEKFVNTQSITHILGRILIGIYSTRAKVDEK